jgi:hypothetical protein
LEVRGLRFEAKGLKEDKALGVRALKVKAEGIYSSKIASLERALADLKRDLSTVTRVKFSAEEIAKWSASRLLRSVLNRPIQSLANR